MFFMVELAPPSGQQIFHMRSTKAPSTGEVEARRLLGHWTALPHGRRIGRGGNSTGPGPRIIAQRRGRRFGERLFVRRCWCFRCWPLSRVKHPGDGCCNANRWRWHLCRRRTAKGNCRNVPGECWKKRKDEMLHSRDLPVEGMTVGTAARCGTSDEPSRKTATEEIF